MAKGFCTKNINRKQAGALQTIQSKQRLTLVPEQMVQLSHKATAAYLHLFKSHNQSFPQTQRNVRIKLSAAVVHFK